MALALKGIAGGADNGVPCFSAYAGAAQSLANSTFTKIQCQTEEFDTNNNYDTALYRFTPTIAGYYQIHGHISFSSSAALVIATIYKNGAEFKRGNQSGSAVSSGTSCEVSALIYMNGTTDYLELFGFQSSGGALSLSINFALNYLQGFLVRPA